MIEKNRGNNNGIPLSGIGYVVIPNNCDIKEYIQKCYRNSSVSISGGQGCTYMHNVRITIDALHSVKFPEIGKLGSPVIWIRDCFTNRPVVIGVLNKGGESNFTEIYQQRIFQEIAEQVCEIFLDAKNSRLLLSALGNDNIPSEVVIKASSKKAEGDTVKLISKDVLLLEGKKLKLLITDSIDLSINNGKKEILAIKANDSSLELKDQFENLINIDEENIKINAKKINLGEGAEPMVLGDTLLSLLEQLVDAITSLTVVTPTGPSGTPINSVQFIQIKSKLRTILSKLSNTD